jgi:hypothetical protein
MSGRVPRLSLAEDASASAVASFARCFAWTACQMLTAAPMTSAATTPQPRLISVIRAR